MSLKKKALFYQKCIVTDQLLLNCSLPGGWHLTEFGPVLAHRSVNVVLQRSILEHFLFKVCIYQIAD
jgi:hypothetical protein